MNNLGIPVEKSDTCCPEPSKPNKTQSYPKFCLKDDQVDKFLGGYDLEKDDEIEVTVRLRCCGWSDTEYCKSVDFDVLEASDPVSVDGSKDAEADDANEGPVKKASKKMAPEYA